MHRSSVAGDNSAVAWPLADGLSSQNDPKRQFKTNAHRGRASLPGLLERVRRNRFRASKSLHICMNLRVEFTIQLVQHLGLDSTPLGKVYRSTVLQVSSKDLQGQVATNVGVAP